METISSSGVLIIVFVPSAGILLGFYFLFFLFQTTLASLHMTTLASHCCTGSLQTLKAEEEKLAGSTEENKIEEVGKELVGKAKREM